MTAAVCHPTGKHRYPAWDIAVRYALRASKRAGRPMRVYECPACHGFHLTRRTTWTERRAA